jgi:hypothetical protein
MEPFPAPGLTTFTAVETSRPTPIPTRLCARPRRTTLTTTDIIVTDDPHMPTRFIPVAFPINPALIDFGSAGRSRALDWEIILHRRPPPRPWRERGTLLQCATSAEVTALSRDASTAGV